MTLQRWLGLSLTLVAIAALGWLAWHYDWHQVWDALLQARWQYVVLIALAVVCEQGLRAIKWHILLRRVAPMHPLSVFNAIMAGFAAGVIVPFGVSPVVRSWLLARRFDVPMMTVLTTASIDRMVDAGVFLVFAVVGVLLIQLPGEQDDLLRNLYLAIVVNVVVLSAIAVLLVLYRNSIDNESSWVQRLFNRLPQRLLALLRPLTRDIADGVSFPGLLNGGLTIIAATFLMRCLTLALFLFGGLALGIHFSIEEYVFLIVIPGFAYVLARLIRAPGGFVVGGVFALTLVGVVEETAIALMTLIHVTTAAIVCIIGIPALIKQGVTIAELRRPNPTVKLSAND